MTVMGIRAVSPGTQEHENTICSRLAPNPVDDAGLLSFATFSWLTPVMIQSYKHTLTVDTLPPLSPYDASDINAKRYAGSPRGGIVSKGSQEFCVPCGNWQLLSSCSLRCELNCLPFLARSLGKVWLGRKDIEDHSMRLGAIGATLWTVSWGLALLCAVWSSPWVLYTALGIISGFIFFFKYHYCISVLQTAHISQFWLVKMYHWSKLIDVSCSLVMFKQ